jgi:GNAT superfamily N-acetyltransferase
MQVQIADAENINHCVNLMTLAFADDPVCRYLYPDTASYITYFPEYARIYGGPGFGRNGTHIFGTSGAALWVPPNTHPDENDLNDLLDRSVSRAAKAELFAVYEAFDAALPDEPHWYLPLMGVDPMMMGQGIGSALMKFGLSICDTEGSLAYLESTKPENVPFYERFGFTVHHTIEVGGHPPVPTMIRHPR